MKTDYKQFDYLLLGVTVAFSVFGIIMIGSAVSGSAVYGGNFSSQIKWLTLGFIIMLASSFIDYHFICKFYIPIYIVCIILLVAVFFLGSSDSSDTAQVSRWLRFGKSGEIGIQPSEFAKLFMILALAKALSLIGPKINKPLILLGVLAACAAPVLLIYKQPSLSASLVVIFIVCAMLFNSKLSYKYIVTAAAVLVPLCVFVAYDLRRAQPLIMDKILGTYQMGRVELFLHPDKSNPLYYQTDHAAMALSSGQFAGLGLFKGTVSIPQARNDFILALIGEELGFVGCAAVLAVMLFIIFKCLIAANKSVDQLGRLIACGVAAMLTFQVFIHVGVNTGMIPNTGVAFPFLSYGGSSLWINMCAVGIINNIGMHRSKSIFEK